jgi:hypothetical protein
MVRWYIIAQSLQINGFLLSTCAYTSNYTLFLPFNPEYFPYLLNLKLSLLYGFVSLAKDLFLDR